MATIERRAAPVSGATWLPHDLLANRPAAAAVGPKVMFFALDDNGGTVYRTNDAGTAWLKLSAGAAAAGGAELGYAEITSNFVTTSLTAVDIPGLAVTVTVGAKPIMVEIGCWVASHSVAGKSVVIDLLEGAVDTGSGFTTSPAASSFVPLGCKRRLAPAPGNHTYKAAAQVFAAGTGTIYASPAAPTFIRVTEA